ncbi:hypothetical protein ACYOEI_06875 [Singulisphaera rosea]
MATNVLPYLNQRLEALAIIHLTRRKDLVVTKSDLDIGVDLFVYINQSREPSRRVFGVMIEGTTDAIADQEEATARLNLLKIQQKGAQVMMPVCVFLFSMQDDQGYYDWQAEPLFEDGRVQLPLKTTFEARELTPHAMDRIIDAVNRWYDAVFKLPVIQGLKNLPN